MSGRITSRGEEIRKELYGRVMVALADPTRDAILRLLVEHGRPLPFTVIKKKLRIQNNATLSHHLDLLQRACLIERTVDLSEPRKANDPYYRYYALTSIGEAIVPHFPKSIRKTIDEALVLA